MPAAGGLRSSCELPVRPMQRWDGARPRCHGLADLGFQQCRDNRGGTPDEVSPVAGNGDDGPSRETELPGELVDPDVRGVLLNP